MYKEKDIRVLAFQAKLNELKEKVPILKHSGLWRHRTQFNVLCGHLDYIVAPFAVDFTVENPDVLIDRIRGGLIEIVNLVEKDIEALEKLSEEQENERTK